MSEAKEWLADELAGALKEVDRLAAEVRRLQAELRDLRTTLGYRDIAIGNMRAELARLKAGATGVDELAGFWKAKYQQLLYLAGPAPRFPEDPGGTTIVVDHERHAASWKARNDENIARAEEAEAERNDLRAELDRLKAPGHHDALEQLDGRLRKLEEAAERFFTPGNDHVTLERNFRSVVATCEKYSEMLREARTRTIKAETERDKLIDACKKAVGIED